MTEQLQLIEQHIQEEAQKLTEHWFRDQCRQLFEEFYLYYDVDNVGAVAVATNPPGPTWQLASDQIISAAWPQSKAYQFILETMKKLPIIKE